MDPLSHFLMLNDIHASIDRHCQFSGEWSEPHAPGDLTKVSWHMLLAGGVQLEVPNAAPHLLQQGSLLFLPQNSPHRLSDSGSEETRVLCGSLQWHQHFPPFLSILPQSLLFCSGQVGMDLLLPASAQLLLTEFEQNDGGESIIISQMMTVLFTLAVRDWLSRETPGSGLMAALLHPRLGLATKQMCQYPQRLWTVENLATAAHMSRANFARVFQHVVGQTPVQALAGFRMQLAAQQLVRHSLPLITIAENNGAHC